MTRSQGSFSSRSRETSKLMMFDRWVEISKILKSEIKNKFKPNWFAGKLLCKFCSKEVKLSTYVLHLRSSHEVAYNYLYYGNLFGDQFMNQLEISFSTEKNPGVDALVALRHTLLQTTIKAKNLTNFKKNGIISIHQLKDGLRKIMMEDEEMLKKSLKIKAHSKNIADNAFVRALVKEKFQVKEEVGDPPKIQKGSREDRRRAEVDRLRRMLERGRFRERAEEIASRTKAEVKASLSTDHNRNATENVDSDDGDEVVFVSESVKFKNGKRKRPFEEPPMNELDAKRPILDPEYQAATSSSKLPSTSLIDAKFSPENVEKYLNSLSCFPAQAGRELLQRVRKQMGGLIIPLTCPLTNKRMEFPARGPNCQHAKLFDAKNFYLKELERCPVCDATVNARELLLDAHISNSLQNNNREYHATITKAGNFKKAEGRYFRLGSNIPNRLHRSSNRSNEKPIVIHDSPRILAKDQGSKLCDSIVLIDDSEEELSQK